MAAYRATIGLEVHAELKTYTKMFCASKNDPEEQTANVNICPVCLAHPGTLPVINKRAVAHVLRVGAALGGKLADYTEFDRKSYFYPDLPKGYQISQYEFPLVSGGELAGVAITRVHLEEDTASSIHDENTGETLIDFNRAGVPLMELVTEPVIESAAQAGNFARELQLLLRYLGVSDANMEKGEMRVEANISISKDDTLGTKVEIKNLNSFRAMERAVAYEIKRQEKLLEGGGTVVQQTLGWDEGKQATFPQRIKEGSADYRYFPDPDLPSLKVSEIPGLSLLELVKQLPELPIARRKRYMDLRIKQEDAELYVRDERFGNFFDTVAEALAGDSEHILLASNYIANDLVNLVSHSAPPPHKARGGRGKASRDLSGAAEVVPGRRDNEKRDTESFSKIPISEKNFVKIISLNAAGKISSRGAKDLLAAVFAGEGGPTEIAKQRNLFQVSEAVDLAPIIEKVLTDNPKAAQEYKSGKITSMKFLIGQAMKATRGTGNPAVLQRALEARLR